VSWWPRFRIRSRNCEDDMENIGKIEVKRLSSEATLPTRAYPDDAGLDIYALEDALIAPSEGKLLSTGVAIAVPAKHVGMVCDRSSMAKKGLKTAGGIIDAGYRGELKIVLWNIGKEATRIVRGERIAQLLILPIQTPAVTEVTDLPPAERGDKGFGSSGR
jgi:dUTP pyrophosphatase